MATAAKSQPATKARTAKSPSESYLVFRMDNETIMNGAVPFKAGQALLKAWKTIEGDMARASGHAAKRTTGRGAPAKK